MQINRRNLSAYALLFGMTLLVIGLATNKTGFSVAAVVMVLLSLIIGGRWMRPRRK
ncbi:MAG: hypothetical protein K8S20_17885 [Chloroflexi bacterium]|nr:hypothetical protein [Chloroflexota bacterium]